MKAKALEIRWHDTQPIYSLDFHAVEPHHHSKGLAKGPVASALQAPDVAKSDTSVSDQPARPASAKDDRKTWRMATAGGDQTVRIWLVHPRPLPGLATGPPPSSAKGNMRSKLETGPRVEYLATLTRHAGVVNAVRFSPIGNMLASAGDDGNILLWMPETGIATATFGDSVEDRAYERENWRVQSMIRTPTGKEIYDLSWSPDGRYILAGSVDHVAYIYEAASASLVHTIAEHTHYVQGVAWDPLNQFIATQSSDRSMHVHSLLHSPAGLEVHAVGKTARMDVQHRASGTWGPVTASASDVHDKTPRARTASQAGSDSSMSAMPRAPVASTSSSMLDRTEVSTAMDPPAARPSSLSRRSSTSSMSDSAAPLAPLTPKLVRSGSPAPLPAIHRPLSPGLGVLSVRVTPAAPTTLPLTGKAMLKLYGDATVTPFFRRLCWSTDGSLLLTPAGLFEDPYATMAVKGDGSGAKIKEKEVISTSSLPKPTVYLYARSNIARPPVAHLPGHKSTSIAIRFCPILLELRQDVVPVDDEAPEQVLRVEMGATVTDSVLPGSEPVSVETEEMGGAGQQDKGKGKSTVKPASLFDLPYRMVYAVATLDAVFLYDTQQAGPICMFGNLHYAPFTDLAWSPDGETLVMSSQDGYCSIVAFEPLELGVPYTGARVAVAAREIPVSVPAPIPALMAPQASAGQATLSFAPRAASSASTASDVIDLTSPDRVATGSGTGSEASMVPVKRATGEDEQPARKGKRIAPNFVSHLNGAPQ